MNFFFISFSEMKMMVRGSLRVKRRCWGNPLLENFTETILVEKQEGERFGDWNKG